jgi:hypothetical protein
MNRPFTDSRITQSNWLAPGCLLAALLIASPMAHAGYDTPAYVQFHPSHYTVDRLESQAVITVFRGGDFRIPAAVDYLTRDGTAVANLDYKMSGGRLVFAAGETEQIFTIPLIRSTISAADDRTVELVLSNPSANVEILGESATLTLTVAAPAESIEAAPPRLVIQGAHGEILLSWETELSNLILEKTEDSASGEWIAVTTPVSFVEGRWLVAEPISETHFFYRLRLAEAAQ